ncbi:amino acid ABC transporter permease [Klebsiella variicola]|uniref:Amino acid ABC transporter permease n=1 Tax=Klebsiella variicola TaxID=244366 RepID=A0A7H4MIE7_KLEVA|nr:amino acid ABC transporter permease [Klebsiella variicola]
MFIDFAFLGETLLKLGAALPVTLGLFICSLSSAAHWPSAFWRCE